jgi:hypothetical protein
MGRSVIITTPIPTADEMAKRLGMGKKRVAEIREIMRKAPSRSTKRRVTSAQDKTERREKAAS